MYVSVHRHGAESIPDNSADSGIRTDQSAFRLNPYRRASAPGRSIACQPVAPLFWVGYRLLDRQQPSAAGGAVDATGRRVREAVISAGLSETGLAP